MKSIINDLDITEIKLSSKYKSEREVNTSFVISLYISLHPTPPPLSLLPTPINYPLTYYNMSQHNFNQILLQMRQQ